MSSEARTKLRSAILSSANMRPQVKVVEFMGEQIEIRQLNLDTVLDMRAGDDTTVKDRIVQSLIMYAYVPGSDTNERIFEEADRDMLLQLPFGPDFRRVQDAIGELTSVDLGTKEAKGNLTGTDSSTS